MLSLSATFTQSTEYVPGKAASDTYPGNVRIGLAKVLIQISCQLFRRGFEDLVVRGSEVPGVLKRVRAIAYLSLYEQLTLGQAIDLG